MRTQGSKVDIIPRELQSLVIIESYFWYKLQLLIKILFCNFIVFVLIPYLFNLFPFFPAGFFWFLLFLLNAIFLISLWRFKSFVPKKYEIACKQGIWKLTENSQIHYARLTSDILLWQWIIIITLYSSARNRRFILVVLKDSLSPQDNARLRRWLLSEFT